MFFSDEFHRFNHGDPFSPLTLSNGFASSLQFKIFQSVYQHLIGLGVLYHESRLTIDG